MREDRHVPRGPLLLLVLAAAVVVAGVSYGAVQLVSNDAAPSTTSGASPSPRSPAPSAPPESPPAEDEGWRAAVERYGVAFTDTSGGQRAWFARLKPLVSPSLAQGYSYTDLRLVPRQQLRRVAAGDQQPGETPTWSATLHYSGGLAVDVTVSQAPETGRWIVTTAVPEEEQ